ncbi:unnamed protein product [Allacma fusca]|uniref:Uncharacterized protein n=1 Tax=Allacma fusca TaxID=39272 RepID=A0A8J2J5E3_9HEXA|nr:unnamed protein product [Allacma fusca]
MKFLIVIVVLALVLCSIGTLAETVKAVKKAEEKDLNVESQAKGSRDGRQFGRPGRPGGPFRPGRPGGPFRPGRPGGPFRPGRPIYG